MRPFKIGAMMDSFRLPPREAIDKCRQLGADGIQVNVRSGEMSPEQMDPARREAFRNSLSEMGLEISALCGDLGGHGFQIARDNPERIRRSKLFVDLAAELGTPAVTTHIGVVPSDPAAQTYQVLLAACRELGDYAASKGVSFAIETGPETAEVLGAFLDEVDSPGIGVNMDPANLVMVAADDPVAAVRTLGGRIVHTHAKDGVQLAPCDPVQVYGAFAVGGIEGLDFGKLFDELPLGEGDVDWDAYLDALEEIGYSGYLTIEREVGDDPVADIAAAVRFLRRKLAGS